MQLLTGILSTRPVRALAKESGARMMSIQPSDVMVSRFCLSCHRILTLTTNPPPPLLQDMYMGEAESACPK